jgi:3-oxoacid CoA-transferase subunit B
LIITMEHTTKDGRPKILKRCSLPLTGERVVTRIITELAVIDVTPEGLVLKELDNATTFEAVQSATEPTLTRSADLKAITR